MYYWSEPYTDIMRDIINVFQCQWVYIHCFAKNCSFFISSKKKIYQLLMTPYEYGT